MNSPRHQDAMMHLTLNTGHVRESPRSEVGDDIIDKLRPLVQTTGGPLPHPRGYSVQITRAGRDAMYTISRVMDDEAAPLVTCGLAVDDPAAVWHALVQCTGGAIQAEMPPVTPWLGVVIHPVALLAPAALNWLGDAERCIAWALIEEAGRVQ